jgi:D-serine deaminase-like pyridoxal phosphate-dependent protein
MRQTNNTLPKSTHDTPTVGSAAGQIGEALSELDTPCLILDLAAFERNLDRLMASLAGLNVAVRPHAKSHKCPEIAKRQIAKGAVGICCQKISEAQAFADEGVLDILLSNEIVGPKKIAATLSLTQQLQAVGGQLTVCVDHSQAAADLNHAAQAAGLTIPVLVELDVGQRRCGVADPRAAVALIEQVHRSSGLRFVGLQAYHGSAQHTRSQTDRMSAIDQACHLIRRIQKDASALGIDCSYVTGAGTGSYLIEARSGVYSEIQPGSYALMDVDYGRNDWGQSDMPVFENSLFIHTAVMSRPDAQRAVVDAGLKSMSVDSGLPTIFERTDLNYQKASDEHGVVVRSHTPSEQTDALGALRDAKLPSLGQTVQLIPGHCDPTVNLYDVLHVVDQGRLVDLWPISARGRLF